MGKSGGRRKKGAANQSAANEAVNVNNVANHSVNNGGIDLDSAVFLKRAHELKEEGNKRFQAKDFVGALEQYDNAIKLIPKTHPDRAVFHSNRAACLMQMKPIDYDSVILECSMALNVQPRFGRALLRRARAYEAIGRYDMAMSDVQALLSTDPNHRDALEIAGKLRVALGPRQEAQQDLQSRPSPAALGASAVRGAPIAGLGPCLPARPVSKKGTGTVGGANVPANNKSEKAQQVGVAENGPDVRTQLPKIILKPATGTSKVNENSVKDGLKEQSFSSSSMGLSACRASPVVAKRWRQLKLVYDHDIRLAQMPVNCSFKALREIVGKRFPSSKFVLIKYKDNDGDLVTITCTDELKLAEACVDSLLPKDPESDTVDSYGILRLHIVEVNPEQEPPILEEEEMRVEEEIKVDESGSQSSLGDSGVDSAEAETDKTDDKAVKELPKRKSDLPEEAECKEVEMDDWLFEFAQLFRNNVGIDPDAHIDLHEVGMELCSEALEETVTSEEAQLLFDKAALKFQEVAALAFFNWGNVHMCAARKKIPVDDNAPEEVKAAQLQTAYHWVREKYSLAREKYEQALSIKPDFYEGLLAMGQQQFEMAKLHWSYVLAKKEDLSSWDSSETFKLFDSAEEKMKAATEMWEKLEEQRANEQKDPKIEELLKRRKKPGNDGEASARVPGDPTPEELAEQAAVMRSQIHLFWGNMLFERSQIEFRLGADCWKKNLDAAVERFKLAGASEADISTVTSNHCSNTDLAGGEKKADDVAPAVSVRSVSEADSH